MGSELRTTRWPLGAAPHTRHTAPPAPEPHRASNTMATGWPLRAQSLASPDLRSLPFARFNFELNTNQKCLQVQGLGFRIFFKATAVWGGGVSGVEGALPWETTRKALMMPQEYSYSR